jgi:LmbE family N-acetylglucosaminyl deacetylase
MFFGAMAVGLALAAAPPPLEVGPTLGLALRRLPVMGTVLVITAHPDDENNAALVAWGHGRGLRTVVLTATRGEGGQNEIGRELGEALGLLRVAELDAVHARDGAEQRFARAYDFGYSFSVDETYEKWGRAEVLADFVWGIRAVRPDVIVTLPREGRGGGQHHQASARLAAEAFRAAADATAFPPASTGGLLPWQARKIYETAVGMGAADKGGVRLETSVPDPLLGATWHERGARAREEHRTQGMRVPPGAPTTSVFTLVDSEPRVSGPENDILDGIDTSWRRLLAFAGPEERPALEDATDAIQAALAAAEDGAVLPSLRSALILSRRLREEALVGDWSERARIEILSRLAAKETDLVEALALAHGITVDVSAEDRGWVPGQAVVVTARADAAPVEGGKLQDLALLLPKGWAAARLDAHRHRIRIPPAAALTRPFGRKETGAARYEVPPAHRAGPVFPPADVVARLHFSSGGVVASLDRPLRGVVVLPLFDLDVPAPTLILPLEGPRRAEVRVRVRHHGTRARAADCALELPAGWRAQPSRVRLHFTKEDEEQEARFVMSAPPGGAATACLPMSAVVRASGRVYRETFQRIDYPHIERRYFPHRASWCTQVLDVKGTEGARVGYVVGAGDPGLEALAQLGVAATALSAEVIASGDLSAFTTIVTGIRAYQTRPDLARHHDRLLDYVRGGGHLVVQYNKDELNRRGEGGSYAPYPARVGRRRITDEASPVRLLRPDHPLLVQPNRLGPADFEGWVQDRGLYLLDAADPQYEELLASEDAWPDNAGEHKGLLVSARLGRGRWTYVGLALWRQLEAGVPGAYRLLANLVGQPPPAP